MKSVSAFSCSNEKCLDYDKEDSGNIVVHSRYGKHDEIRMLKCKTCGSFFLRERTPLFTTASCKRIRLWRLSINLVRAITLEKSIDSQG